jgi:hypothetical protein
MDMFDGVGRRRDQTEGQLVNIGENSLNGNERNCLFRNNGDGSFTDVGYVDRADRVEDGRGLAILDYNQDGRLDVALRSYLRPAHLLRNEGGTNHWLQVQLVGTRSNRDAVGARVTVGAGDHRQIREVHCGSGYLSASSLVQHFGLGSAIHVDSLNVRWPSGEETHLADLAVDRRLRIVEGQGLVLPLSPTAQGE